MFAAILQRELRDHLDSFRFGAVFLLVQATMLSAVLVFSAEYQTRMREYPDRVPGLVDDEGFTNLQNVPCNGGLSVQRLPSRLAFCAGIGERELPNQARFAVHGLKAVQRSGDVADVLASGLPVDWTYVVAVLLSFSAGVLGYRSIAGEREDGTLALALANPVPRATLLLGKYAAILVALVVPLLFGGILGILVLRTYGGVPLGGHDWWRLAMLLVLAVLYLSCAALMALACSVFSRTATMAAVAFLFLWATMVFVAPNVAGMLAARLGEAPTPAQIKGRAEAIKDQRPLAIGAGGEEIARVSRERELAGERLLLEYLQDLGRQVGLGQSLSRVSPASSFVYASEELAAVGMGRLRRFVDNAVRYRQGIYAAVLAADAEDEDSQHRYQPWSCGSRNFSQKKVDLGPTKHFRDALPDHGQALQAAALDVLILVCYNAVLFLLVFARFLRQDVTVGGA